VAKSFRVKFFGIYLKLKNIIPTGTKSLKTRKKQVKLVQTDLNVLKENFSKSALMGKQDFLLAMQELIAATAKNKRYFLFLDKR
jgi:hypothetical protein